jgi:hypothetical protein
LTVIALYMSLGHIHASSRRAEKYMEMGQEEERENVRSRIFGPRCRNSVASGSRDPGEGARAWAR